MQDLALTAEAKQSDRRTQYGGRYDSVKDRRRAPAGVRLHVGTAQLPVLYNNNYQIVQTLEHVMILIEMVRCAHHPHERQHVPPSVRQWLGDSIGH
jgi:hypothetical protein